ncbi:hypothetical protein V0288_24610 [Pannus brasiliensis CCIBt3594]|uniref:NERD domain-containing protein n=1 Tax=Pannus brasiliensis CCIBt3594 TaxID=1427578 RepID=A0AAW9R061_9CHRO
MRDEFLDLAKSLNLDHKYGSIESTDIDLALIDRQEKICIVMELKWFIYPADIRECHDRSKELSKGVQQALKIQNAYKKSNKKLIESVLNIDTTYNFITIVVSKNWIGHFDIQNPEVPIIKASDLIEKIKSFKSLQKTAEWLKERAYLPKYGKDFKIITVDIELGGWHSNWYGVKPI